MSITTELLSTPTPTPASVHERRRFERLDVPEHVSTIIGRSSGRLVDLSANGARVRHSSPLVLHSRVRLTFAWRAERFEAIAEVLASRLIALGSGDVPAQYESRLRFVTVSPENEATLATALNELSSRSLRRLVANLHGWIEDAPQPRFSDRDAKEFIRCVYTPGGWQQKRSRDFSQPLFGFTVPATTDPREINMLCRTYESGDDETRRMVRTTAAAVSTPMSAPS